MNNVSLINRRAKSACERLSDLYYKVASSSSSPSPELLPIALKELGIVSEALQIAVEELDRQNKSFNSLQYELEAAEQQYKNLFNFVPDGYLVSDLSAVIKDINNTGASLLNSSVHNCLGRSFTDFINPEDLPYFHAKLLQAIQQNRLEFSLRLQLPSNSQLHASLILNVVKRRDDEPLLLQWLIRDITERKRAEAALENPKFDLRVDRSLFHFCKGETIPLEKNTIWLVAEGVVKLTTLSDRGEETLVGLVGDSMIFGTSFTVLQTYQATALSDVKLALISSSEIAQFPQLAQALLPALKQRLQQAESLLAIYGQIRVEERFNNLLALLKQMIGQPTEQGVRLSARLTHQDLASACCTTRVTITRLLGKLQEQGKIRQDSHNHLILKE